MYHTENINPINTQRQALFSMIVDDTAWSPQHDMWLAQSNASHAWCGNKHSTDSLSDVQHGQAYPNGSPGMLDSSADILSTNQSGRSFDDDDTLLLDPLVCYFPICNHITFHWPKSFSYLSCRLLVVERINLSAERCNIGGAFTFEARIGRLSSPQAGQGH